jgi:hypothetical protein
MARRHFLEQHLAPGLPPLAAVLEARAPALAPLIRALEALVAADLARSVPPEASRGPAREPAVRRLPIVEER